MAKQAKQDKQNYAFGFDPKDQAQSDEFFETYDTNRGSKGVVAKARIGFGAFVPLSADSGASFFDAFVEVAGGDFKAASIQASEIAKKYGNNFDSRPSIRLTVARNAVIGFTPEVKDTHYMDKAIQSSSLVNIDGENTTLNGPFKEMYEHLTSLGITESGDFYIHYMHRPYLVDGKRVNQWRGSKWNGKDQVFNFPWVIAIFANESDAEAYQAKLDNGEIELPSWGESSGASNTKTWAVHKDTEANGFTSSTVLDSIEAIIASLSAVSEDGLESGLKDLSSTLGIHPHDILIGIGGGGNDPEVIAKNLAEVGMEVEAGVISNLLP